MTSSTAPSSFMAARTPEVSFSTTMLLPSLVDRITSSVPALYSAVTPASESLMAVSTSLRVSVSDTLMVSRLISNEPEVTSESSSV